MNLNRRSPLPLYVQLADILKGKIERQEYPAGSRLPSEPTLAKSFGLGRPTIRQALGLLVQEGRLERRKGSGSYVREGRPPVDLFSLAGTSSAFLEQGILITQRLRKKISLVPVKDDPGNPLSGRAAFFFSRLSLFRADPVLLEETYIDPTAFPGIDRFDFAEQSLARIVREHFYLTPVSCRQTFRIVFDRARGPLLGLPRGRPLLLATRTIHFPGHENAIHSLLFCRTDLFTFSQTLGGYDET